MKTVEELYRRVAELVERRSANDPTAGEPLRGLVIPETAARYFARRGPLGAPARPPESPVGAFSLGGRLGERFGLSALDEGILLIGVAPDIDRRFEPLYGYLNDDVSRRRATVQLALELLGLGPHLAQARHRFHRGSPLLAGGLLELEDGDRPLPGRSLRVPERVVAHLLGADPLDEALLGHARLLPPPAGARDPVAARLGALRAEHPLLVHVRASDFSYATRAVHAVRRPALVIRDASPALLAPAVREARLRDATLIIGPLPRDSADLVAALAAQASLAIPADQPAPAGPADPAGPAGPATRVTPAAPDDTGDSGAFGGRGGAAIFTFGPDAPDPAWAPGVALLTVEAGPLPPAPTEPALASFRLSPARLDATRTTARLLAELDGEPLSGSHLQRAARQQSAPLADRNVRRVPPAVGWPDLMLPERQFAQLHELVARARTRRRVLGDWRMRAGGGRGQGVTALFAGESGTGKTLAAEVVAGELGLDLYVVDLAGLVDKYVGETEKNLESVFTAAAQSEAVLLFDEADVLFGKRGEVRDARDRYANLESAYLLQRLESFDGIAVLTTNLRANIDDAFTRRFDLVVDFPFPDVELRARLWRLALAGAPAEADLDPVLKALAVEFELAGGAIRSAAVTAAYLAADRGSTVTAADVRSGAEREYRKLGRLVPTRM